MVQAIKMTDKEKLRMYMKCSKKELAKMLIECNRIIEGHFERGQLFTFETPTMRPNVEYYTSF